METKMEKKYIKNFWEAAKEVSSKRKFKSINTYIKKKEKSQINNLTLYLKELGKKQTKPKVSRRKELRLEQK